MEAGIKFYSHNQVSGKDLEFADFVEILPVPSNPYGFFPQFKKKYKIHCAHYSFGFNPSDVNSNELNKMLIKQAVEAADRFRSDRIVVHGGFNTDELKIKKPAKIALKFLQDNFDERFCVENLLAEDEGMVEVGHTPEEMALFVDAGFKFCLDFGHAVATAASLKKDYKEFIAEFLKLKPHYFHLSGPLNGIDKHLSIFDSDTDIDFFKQTIKKHDKPVCLETPVDSVVRKKEIEYLKK